MAADLFGLHVQAFSKYGSEKKGLPTNYYLTLASEPVRLHAELNTIEFVAIQNPLAFSSGDPLQSLAAGGTIYMQSDSPPEKVWATLPASIRRTIVDHGFKLWILDAARIARMKRGAQLINVGRGLLLDEAALIRALECGAYDFLCKAEMTAAAFERHPMRHVLTSVVGARPELDVRVDERELTDGQTIVLCTDGLHGALPDRELEAVLKAERDLDRAAARLVDTAVRRDGRDNVTVALARYSRTP